ncbi:MAG TPA: polysaccharide deacetylase [Nitrospira sp.]|nr:polysaccharide deacetylase [Nitrospira sp.]
MKQQNVDFAERLRAAVSGGRSMWPDGKRAALLLTYDMDADSSWISRGLDEPVARSAGQFEVNVGTPCILELMKWFGVKSTFFTPGWIVEQYPKMVEAVVKDGHEIGLHGYLHEPPPKLAEKEEVEIVRRGSEALAAMTGRKPVGYRSPIWQFSPNTVRILHQAGFKYTSDFMHTLLPTFNDVDGTAIDMVNLPGCWPLDDAVYFQFHITIRTALRRAADVLEIYKEEFRAVYAVGGLFTLVMHPQLSGRPSRVLMLKEFMDYVRSFDDVWMPMPIDVVEYWRTEHGPPRLLSSYSKTAQPRGLPT